MEDKYVKVMVAYESPIVEQEVVETLWASRVEGEKEVYKLKSIPFYGINLASGDLIKTELDEDGEIISYVEKVSSSGNSVIAVMVLVELNEDQRTEIYKALKKVDCNCEALNEKYFVVDIPKNTNYIDFLRQIVNYVDKKVIDYVETSISEKHLKDIDIYQASFK